MLAMGAPGCHAVALILTHLGSVAQRHATRKVSDRLPTAHHITEILSSAALARPEIPGISPEIIDPTRGPTTQPSPLLKTVMRQRPDRGEW
jgi:hypothetical protein